MEPFDSVGFALLPGVKGLVAKVVLGLVCLNCKGGAGHSQSVGIEKGSISTKGFQYPSQEEVKHCQELEEKERQKRLGSQEAEATLPQKLHVEIFITLVRRSIVAEINLAPNSRWGLLYLPGSQQVHPSHVACRGTR